MRQRPPFSSYDSYNVGTFPSPEAQRQVRPSIRSPLPRVEVEIWPLVVGILRTTPLVSSSHIHPSNTILTKLHPHPAQHISTRRTPGLNKRPRARRARDRYPRSGASQAQHSTVHPAIGAARAIHARAQMSGRYVTPRSRVRILISESVTLFLFVIVGADWLALLVRQGFGGPAGGGGLN